MMHYRHVAAKVFGQRSEGFHGGWIELRFGFQDKTYLFNIGMNRIGRLVME